MQTVFFRLVTLVALLSILIGIFGLSYTYRVDHRTARSLSAYARIDFQASTPARGVLRVRRSHYGITVTTQRSCCRTSCSTPTAAHGR